MLRISWTEHVTNEEVFTRANTKPTLLDGLLKAFHGHLVRKDGITPGLCSNALAFANANAAFALALAFDSLVTAAFALAFAFDSSAYAFALAFDSNAFD